MSKCHFAQRQLRYLGHVISEDGVATDPDKINVVLQWPVPQSVKALHSFLGLAGYYRRFVKHFGIISKPLMDLLRKGAVYVWTDIQDKAFSALKQALTTAPVLGLPDFSRPFSIETDASGTRIGAVLMQGASFGISEQSLRTPLARIIHVRERVYGNLAGTRALAQLSATCRVSDHHLSS